MFLRVILIFSLLVVVDDQFGVHSQTKRDLLEISKLVGWNQNLSISIQCRTLEEIVLKKMAKPSQFDLLTLVSFKLTESLCSSRYFSASSCW
jgi:hypothetical protein